jgi:hypothetical protein
MTAEQNRQTDEHLEKKNGKTIKIRFDKQTDKRKNIQTDREA